MHLENDSMKLCLLAVWPQESVHTPLGASVSSSKRQEPYYPPPRAEMTFPQFLIYSAQCLIKDKKSLITGISHGSWYCHHIHYCYPAIWGFREPCPSLNREEKWGPILWMSPESSKHLLRYKLRSRPDTRLDLTLLLRNLSWAILRGCNHRKVPRILGSTRAGLFKSQLPNYFPPTSSLRPTSWWASVALQCSRLTNHPLVQVGRFRPLGHKGTLSLHHTTDISWEQWQGLTQSSQTIVGTQAGILFS